MSPAKLAVWVFAFAAGCGPSAPDPGPSTDPTPAVAEVAPVPEDPPPGDAKTQVAAKAEAPAETPKAPAWKPRPEDEVKPEHAIEFIDALDPLFSSLAKLDDGADEDGLVRVVHLGASMIGADDLTSILRRKFQTRFGDGGAGLVLLQRYMPNYRHRWVTLNANNWEHCYIAYLCKKDGHYGLGGTTFWSDGGAATTIATRKEELGDEVAHFEVWYTGNPRGGRLEVRVDKNEREVLRTRADALEDRYHDIDVEQGPHKITVRALGGGRVRAYGVVLETKGPGIVWDQFSMLGAFTKRMHGWDDAHIAGQIKQRDPDLIAFTYGGNDLRRVATKKLSKEKYVSEYLEAVQKVRAGKPDAACLIVGITDRGKSLHFDITPAHVETIVQGQRETAQKAGCAFFDTYTAMGGGGSLKRWLKKKPPLATGDLKHLNHRGREVFAGWIYDGVIAGYVEYRRKNG